MSFEGLRVLITESTRGIGKAAAIAFLERGAMVAINGRRDGDVAEAMTELGAHSLVATPGDLGTADGAHNVVNTAINGLGGLDVRVNNTGVFDNGPIENVSEEIYDWMMDIASKVRSLRPRPPFPSCAAAGVPS
ncbi:MAG: hypothetical protein CMM46_15085 [Rhodospirillaceae bacterium]|nr:hypothetical protein [Rhodospirillaceae bacterium]|tara:strand:- start:290 stop:691 length:402 start_codon:yes stop_codon:yes gene_type:complete